MTVDYAAIERQRAAHSSQHHSNLLVQLQFGRTGKFVSIRFRMVFFFYFFVVFFQVYHSFCVFTLFDKFVHALHPVIQSGLALGEYHELAGCHGYIYK